MNRALTYVLREELLAQDYKGSLAKKSLIRPTKKETKHVEALTTICGFFS